VAAAARSRRADATAVRPVTSVRTLEADGIRIFYRETGPPDGAVVLLLHGFPARNDLPNAHVQFLDTGHFATGTHVVDIAAAMRAFLDANGLSPVRIE
jgi:pimeloyl-ACP methyl ester carboxylesterase